MLIIPKHWILRWGQKGICKMAQIPQNPLWIKEIPWLPGIHENPKLNLLWQLLFLKLFNFVKKRKVMFYLIPFSENVFVYFLNRAEWIILNLFEYVPYTIRDYKKDLTFSETFKKIYSLFRISVHVHRAPTSKPDLRKPTTKLQLKSSITFGKNLKIWTPLRLPYLKESKFWNLTFCFSALIPSPLELSPVFGKFSAKAFQDNFLKISSLSINYIYDNLRHL